VIPGAERNTTVIANPIQVRPCSEASQDRAAIRREQAIPEGAFVVGFASRLVERKGWGDFLDALALLAPTLPVYFLLAGNGEDRDKARARVRELGLEERGRILGHIDWMKRFYACLDCFVMPSHWEPHGLSHLEAQGFGVPVVVASVPGLRSTVVADRDALLFEAGDASSLADCIRRLVEDPAIRERLIAGGLANSARYTMDAFAASLNEVYAFAADGK
jgi:glycosyltransferase involved in cell wall biosynthesis